MSNPILPESVYETLVAVCAAYPWPTVQDHDHLGEILNAVAWEHRAGGWGLSRKTGGTHVESPVGPIAEDILQTPDGHHYDVLGGAAQGRPLQPGRATSIGIINLDARPWVAPVAHTLSWESAAPPTPTSPPPVTPAPPSGPNESEIRYRALDAKLDAVLTALDDAKQQQARDTDQIGKWMVEQAQGVVGVVGDVKVTVEALEKWLRSRRALGF